MWRDPIVLGPYEVPLIFGSSHAFGMRIRQETQEDPIYVPSGWREGSILKTGGPNQSNMQA